MDNKIYKVIDSIIDVPFDESEREKHGIITAVTNKGTIWLKPLSPAKHEEIEDRVFYLVNNANDKNLSIDYVVKEILSLLSPALNVDEWISADDEPEYLGYYLVYDPNSPVYKIDVARFDTYTKTWFQGSHAIHPSYYKPLPKPPKIN